jgi:hypothetical protein
VYRNAAEQTVADAVWPLACRRPAKWSAPWAWHPVEDRLEVFQHLTPRTRQNTDTRRASDRIADFVGSLSRSRSPTP